VISDDKAFDERAALVGGGASGQPITPPRAVSDGPSLRREEEEIRGDVGVHCYTLSLVGSRTRRDDRSRRAARRGVVLLLGIRRMVAAPRGATGTVPA
jgi:hypothetical protein